MDTYGNLVSKLYSYSRHTPLIFSIMKMYLTVKTLLVAGLIFLCNATTKANDVTLTIPETSVQQLFEAMVHARFLNVGSSGDSETEYFNIRTKNSSIDIKPNNIFEFSFGIDTYADFSISSWSFLKPKISGTLEGEGSLQCVVENGGFSVKFQIDNIAFSGGSWLENIIMNIGILAFRDKIPDLTTSSNQPLLPNSVSSIFYPDFPYITTTEDAIKLSYDLSAGPRYILAANDVNGIQTYGSIENTTGGEENMHNSPHRFEWYTGEEKTIRTPNEILEPQPQHYFKYEKWTNATNPNPLPTISPREIEIVVGNQDETYKAKFKEAVRIQATNSLEWSLSGGQVSYNGQAAATQDNYEFIDGSQTKQLISTPPSNGIERIFRGWTDGNMNPTRTVALGANANLTAYWKAKSHSTVSSVVGLDNRRMLATDDHLSGGPFVFRAYESAGLGGTSQIWVQYRTASSQEWSNEFSIPTFIQMMVYILTFSIQPENRK